VVQHGAKQGTRAHFLIQPGWHNSGAHHWQTLWEQELGPDATRVPQRDWNLPDRAAWTQTLEDSIRRAPRPVVVLAHSVGCLAALTALARTPTAAAVLVAPADAERPGAPPAVESFNPIPMERMPLPLLVVASDNDPYCSLDRARAFAGAWQAELEIVREGGHLNEEAGFGPWPDGKLMVMQWLARHSLLWPDREADGA
jgi:predicted alpha/beta hydrolase family esterase